MTRMFDLRNALRIACDPEIYMPVDLSANYYDEVTSRDRSVIYVIAAPVTSRIYLLRWGDFGRMRGRNARVVYRSQLARVSRVRRHSDTRAMANTTLFHNIVGCKPRRCYRLKDFRATRFNSN